MAHLKRKGDLADLIVERGDRLERVQVKHTARRGNVLEVRCRSLSLTAGRVRQVKRYTASEIDWLVAYDPSSGKCFYVPAAELGAGRDTLTLRLGPARNNQLRGVRMAQDYASLPPLA